MAPVFSNSVFSALKWIYRSVRSKNRWFRIIRARYWRPGIGFLVVFFPTKPGLKPLIGIALKPDHQGKGVGASAMIEAIKFLGEMGFKAVRLSVRLDNLRARRLYKSLGFIAVLRKSQPYFEGTCFAEVMELNLKNWQATIAPND